jgi:hypothetical protein
MSSARAPHRSRRWAGLFVFLVGLPLVAFACRPSEPAVAPPQDDPCGADGERPPPHFFDLAEARQRAERARACDERRAREAAELRDAQPVTSGAARAPASAAPGGDESEESDDDGE